MAFTIDATDRILIISVYPEDLAVGCGGFISKYHSQIDILCSGSFKNLSQIAYDEFIRITEMATVNKVYIKNPSETSSETDYQNFMPDLDMNNYDIILIPNKDDGNAERKYVSDTLLKNLLEKQDCKDCLKVLRYEIWNPLKEATYYEDITSFVEQKRKLVFCYKNNNDTIFAERVLNLNKFRTFTSYLNGSAQYVEAFFVDDLSAYLEKPDIVNETTDKDFQNAEIEEFLKRQNTQTKINALAERYKDKKVIIFGAGEFSRSLFKNYNLSGLDITAIADRRFEQVREHDFYGIKCIKPQDIKTENADVVLISTLDFVKFYDILTNTILKDYDIEIAPIIQTNLSDCMKGDIKDKVCTHPFHIVSIVPTGHCITCCPAYIKNFTIGNIFKDDFESIWRGKRAEYLRNALMNGDYTTCDLNTCIYIKKKKKKEMSEYYEDGKIKMPDTIFMSWDYDCNVACITCRNQIIKNDEKTLNELQTIESSVLDACRNAKFLYTSGNGDPFGSSYARELIKKIVKTNPQIKFLIHTNGVLCSENMCRELNIADKIDSVTFSIHASCKETYDKIVRYGNFDKVIQNLEWISSLKKDGKINNLYLVFVVHKLNYKDMPDFVRMAEKYDATASFRYYRQWSHNTEYKYSDMAVFEKTHPEYKLFVDVLQDKIFDSPNCALDPSLSQIRNCESLTFK